jgi:hypothetical protein
MLRANKNLKVKFSLNNYLNTYYIVHVKHSGKTLGKNFKPQVQLLFELSFSLSGVIKW